MATDVRPLAVHDPGPKGTTVPSWSTARKRSHAEAYIPAALVFLPGYDPARAAGSVTGRGPLW